MQAVSLVSVSKLDVSVSASLVRHSREAMPSAYYLAYLWVRRRMHFAIGVWYFREVNLVVQVRHQVVMRVRRTCI